MLRINSLQSASDYYTKSLTKGDYYSEQSEINGKWAGSLVKELGLGEEVQKSEFDNLCAGKHPYTGEKLTSRLSSDRREAYDFTFSVPKSVSLLGAITRNSEIERVIIESVTETMRLVEQNIQCRVRESGKQENRVSGNMVYGYFLHRNSRPIDGYSDPQLHVHAVVLNLTFDKVENKWKALEVRDKKENAPYYQAVFDSTLALKLKNIGVPVERRRGDFEITGITDKTIEAFSRRTDTINKEAEIKNIFNPDLKGELGARTRHSKNDKHSQSQLREIYLTLLSPEQKQVMVELENLMKMQTHITPNQEVEQPQQADKTEPSPQALKHLDYTLEKAFERHSSMSEQRLIGEVLKEGLGDNISLAEVNLAIAKYKEDNILVSELNHHPLKQVDFVSP